MNLENETLTSFELHGLLNVCGWETISAVFHAP